MQTTSGKSNLMHGIISLPDTTSYDQVIKCFKKEIREILQIMTEKLTCL